MTKAVYFGPIQHNPLFYDLRIETINPTLTCFDWGGRNGWLKCLDTGSVLKNTINLFTYENFRKGIDWHQPSTKSMGWIKVGKDQVLMDVSALCKKGLYRLENDTNGQLSSRTYLDTLAKMMINGYKNSVNDAYTIKNIWQTLYKYQNQHEFFTEAYKSSPILDNIKHFFQMLIDADVPFIYRDDVYIETNTIIELIMSNNGVMLLDEWLTYKPLGPAVYFEAEPNKWLYTRRYRMSGLNGLIRCNRLTFNPNNTVVRSIGSGRIKRKEGWLFYNEK